MPTFSVTIFLATCASNFDFTFCDNFATGQFHSSDDIFWYMLTALNLQRRAMPRYQPHFTPIPAWKALICLSCPFSIGPEKLKSWRFDAWNTTIVSTWAALIERDALIFDTKYVKYLNSQYIWHFYWDDFEYYTLLLIAFWCQISAAADIFIEETITMPTGREMRRTNDFILSIANNGVTAFRHEMLKYI